MHDAGPVGPEEPRQVPAVEANQSVQPAIEEPPSVYAISVDEGPLWCCEILSDVSQRRQSFASLRAAEPEIDVIVHPFCIVVSQDCDLEQDFRVRRNGKPPQLPSVLLCEVSLAEELRGNVAPGTDIWKRIIQNKDERYQFLRAVATEQDALNRGIGSLGIDFRRYFSVPTEELYEQFNLGAQRRCRLDSPYKEHFMLRFANFLCRVGLPLDHHVER